jgi:hypothetical protein
MTKTPRAPNGVSGRKTVGEKKKKKKKKINVKKKKSAPPFSLPMEAEGTMALPLPKPHLA